MAPMITLYILAGCVGVAAALFVVMLVLSAMRPPQLPDISPPPPLQRMIRALTPMPFAPAGMPFEDEAPTRALPPKPRYAVQIPAVPAPPTSTAPTVMLRNTAQPPPVPTYAPPRPAPPPPPPPMPRVAAPVALPLPPASPFVWELPSTPAPKPATAPRFDLRRSQSHPPFPRRRKRIWLRVVVVMFVMSILAAGAVVAFPSLLDPLCDDYEWIGGDIAVTLREQAQLAHDAVINFLATL
jgi:hypothetical protein